MTRTILVVSALLLFVSAPTPGLTQAPTEAAAQGSTRAPVEAVSLVDLLVEGQTLYTLAVDKEPVSLTAALELARQAQRVVADDTVRKRLGAGARPDPHDLTVLGALRARIGVLVGTIEKRRDYFRRQHEDIQNMVQRKRLGDARLALSRLPADAPTADPACPFAELRAEVARTIAIADDYRAQGDDDAALGLADDAIALYRRAQAVDPWGADYDALGRNARDRSAFLVAKRKEIRVFLKDHRLSSAARELAAIEASLPAGSGLYQFQVLKTELLDRQADLSVTVQGAEAAMVSQKYSTAERLYRDAAAIDRDQLFEDQIRRAKELAKGRTPNALVRIFRSAEWLTRPVNQIRALVQAGRWRDRRD